MFYYLFIIIFLWALFGFYVGVMFLLCFFLVGKEGVLSCSLCPICASGLHLPFFAFWLLLKPAAFISAYFTIRFGGSVRFSYIRLLSNSPIS